MEKLIHLLIPRQSNNHKAKILHPSSLLVVSMLLIAFQLSLQLVSKINPDILGYASSISRDEVINLTNRKRAEAGLPPLAINNILSQAAQAKGVDMINRDYWAHVAPDGTQPWSFFSNAGYRYRYAGENLARDFSNASSAVDAWMNSPTHKENILNPKYKEIGIGIVEGDLAGSDTTIIVQFFGSTYADRVAQPLAEASKTESLSKEVEKNTTIEKTVIQKEEIQTSSPVPISTDSPVLLNQGTKGDTFLSESSSEESAKVLVSPFTTSRSLSLAIVILLLVVFVVDAILVSRRKIVRIAGRTFAHVAFLGMILTIILILKSGNIL